MRYFLTICLIAHHIVAISQIPNTLTTSDKIYGVSKFWQEVNYNFIFLDKVNRGSWDSLYKKTLIDVIDTKNDYAYYRILDKFCAFLKDGHTNILYPKELIQHIMINDFGEYRISLSNIEGKAIVTRINLSKKDEIPIGSEVISVNGKKTKNYIDEFVMPFIAASTDYVRQNQSVYELLKGVKGEKYQIELLLPDGKIKKVKLTHQLCSEKELYLPTKKRELLEYKELDNNIHYIAINSFGSNKIDTLFKNILPSLYKAKSIIIDLRNNGGGSTNIGFNVLQHFTNDSVLYGSKSISRNHIPTYKAWGAFLTPKDTLQDKPEWEMTKEDMAQSYLMANDIFYYKFPYEPTKIKINDKRIVVPTVVLMGNNTASAAEDFLIYADPLPNFTFIGDKSYGSTGQPYLFDLVGGARARVCTKKDMYPSGKEFVGYGVMPDIFVSYTLQDYTTLNDPVLQKAIEFLRGK